MTAPLTTPPRISKRERKSRAAANRALVDEYGALTQKLQPFKPEISRMNEIAKGIRSWFEDDPPGAICAAEGDHYRVIVGACSNETRIEDMQTVYERLGHDRFIKACAMSLKALAEAGLTSGVIATLTTKEQTGSRSLTVTEITEE